MALVPWCSPAQMPPLPTQMPAVHRWLSKTEACPTYLDALLALVLRLAAVQHGHVVVHVLQLLGHVVALQGDMPKDFHPNVFYLLGRDLTLQTQAKGPVQRGKF